MDKKEWIIRAFNNEEGDRVPMGFWFHFLEDEPNADVLETPEKLDITLAGHKKYITEFRPDFAKIMCDGFFQYPLQNGRRRIECLQDLSLLQPLDAAHPWVRTQADFVRRVADFDRSLLSVYSTFSPSSLLRYKLQSPLTMMDLLEEDAEAVTAALDRMADGVCVMIKEVAAAAGVDGFYLSVGSPDSQRLSDDDYRQYITPSEKKVLAAINESSVYSMMHICGWGGQRNNLDLFKDYDIDVFNWATHVENIGLAEGKRILGGNCAVMGGFPSEKGSFLYKGATKEEIQTFAVKLVRENGKKGVLIGADCTMPMDMPWERLHWVREALRGL